MKKNKKGAALVLTLVVISLLISFATIVSLTAAYSIRLTSILERRGNLKLIAEAGRDRGEVALKNYIAKNSDTIFDPVLAAAGATFNPSDAAPGGIDFDLGTLGVGANYTCKVYILPDILNKNGNNQGMLGNYEDVNLTTNPNYHIPSSISDNLPKKYPDKATNRMLDYILIRSVAKNKNTNETKVLDTYIDKNDISNVYFDRLFNSSLTVVPKASVATNSFTVSNNTSLDLSGTMLLQANNVTLQPNLLASASKLKMDEGDIYVKADKINLPTAAPNLHPTSESLNTIHMYKSSNTKLDPATSTEWKDTLIRGLDMLDVAYNQVQVPTSTYTDPENAQFMDVISVTDAYGITTDSNKVDVKGDYIKYNPPFVDQATNSANSTKIIPTVAAYKVKCNTAGKAINFNHLIDGIDNNYTLNGIYAEILMKLKASLPGSQDDGTEATADFGKVYKLIIVDGDLTIPTNPYENINNYIIYCTGHVSFQGTASFYNSSIFANSITFDGGPNSEVIFYGVNTYKARTHDINAHITGLLGSGQHVGALNLFDFNQADKDFIMGYLIRNLKGASGSNSYGDYLNFRTIDWREY